MTRICKLWVGSLLLVALFTLISVLWFDKPVAVLVHDLFGSQHFGRLANSPGQSIPLISAVVFVLIGFAAVSGRPASKPQTAVLICTVSLLVTGVIKNQLKFVFGRTWPDSWEPGILSFIHDKQFGFHFFHSGPSFESFPSGHAAAAAAVMSVIWIMFPKLRAVCATFVAAADIGLVILNLHFVSDVVVGSFVGISIGLFTAALWSARDRPIHVARHRQMTNFREPQFRASASGLIVKPNGVDQAGSDKGHHPPRAQCQNNGRGDPPTQASGIA